MKDTETKNTTDATREKRDPAVPFASDRQGHYDVDGTSYADHEVVVSGDALNPVVNRDAEELRRKAEVSP